ncbi:MAG TPA: hypothetical protein VI033_00960 [Candidatus Nitrosopolaris sp.]
MAVGASDESDHRIHNSTEPDGTFCWGSNYANIMPLVKDNN